MQGRWEINSSWFEALPSCRTWNQVNESLCFGELWSTWLSLYTFNKLLKRDSRQFRNIQNIMTMADFKPTHRGWKTTHWDSLIKMWNVKKNNIYTPPTFFNLDTVDEYVSSLKRKVKKKKKVKSPRCSQAGTMGMWGVNRKGVRNTQRSRKDF